MPAEFNNSKSVLDSFGRILIGSLKLLRLQCGEIERKMMIKCFPNELQLSVVSFGALSPSTVHSEKTKGEKMISED